MSEQKAIATITSQVVARGVFVKLIIFTIALLVAPLSSYYASLYYLWGGNSTLAALTAVCAANMVLILYIIASLREDQESITSKKSPGESRKDR